jgi:two-component system capsular synthesis sensor histidine kinase RcsC
MIMQTLTNASDFLAIEQGELVLEEGEFSPIEAFGTIESFFCDTIQRANLSFYLFIDPNLPKMIFSDSKRIRQILFNLIDNAIKFTPSNGIITIEVTYEPRDCVMIFSVEDNGIGISLEDQKTLFEPYNGQGLGLPLSFSLAKLLDSECKVRSKKDEGSRFYFSLPLSGKIRDGSFSFDLALLATFRPILIFDPIHFLIRKLLLRYLKSFGCPIENIMVLTAWKQIEGIKPTHILCDAQSLHSKWIQPLLDTGVRLIVIDSTLSPIESLKGDISSLGCTFDVMQLYSVLKNGSLSNGSLLNKTASEIALRGHLLIVDSNAINSKFLHEMGTKLGFKVLTALNEQDAILMYSDAIEEKSPFDLILMDEVMDGVEIATSILKFEEEYGLDHTPIVSINRNVPTEKNQSPHVGIDQQIFEPITIKKLSELFEHILSSKS